jgi:SAM-dependent methyltransferase
VELKAATFDSVFSSELEEAYSYVDRLGLEFCFHVVRELQLFAGDRVSPSPRVAPEAEYLLGTVLDILAEEGYVARESDAWRVCRSCPDDSAADLQREARERCPGAEPILELLNRCHQHAPAFLSGRQPGLNVVFPRGDMRLWERVHREDLVMSLYADLIPPCLPQVLAGGAARILEVGAGVGGVLQRCLRVLEQHGIEEYWFTDLGKLFVDRMERHQAGRPFMRFAVIDLDVPLAEQGIAPASFDAIIGVNVLHSARNLLFTLRELRWGLRKGGRLILGEGSPPRRGRRWRLDIVFAFLRGWWDVQLDARFRPRPGFLFPSEWLECARASGYCDAQALPGEAWFSGPCRGGLLIARKGDE